MSPIARRSHLLAGVVRHRRSLHTDYEFTHRVWYLAADLAELGALGVRLLSVNRRNVLTLRDADHFAPGHPGIAAEVARRLRANSLDPAQLRTTLVTYPRAFGYVFNPVSFYLAHDDRGVLRMVLAEVHNTHGDREVYEFLPEPGERADNPAGAAPPIFHGQQAKRMYVSPFIGSEARYHLRVWESETHLTIALDETEAAERSLHASIQLRRLPLTDRQLVRLLVRDPVVPLKTSALIFWHAVRLRLKGVRWNRYRRQTGTR